MNRQRAANGFVGARHASPLHAILLLLLTSCAVLRAPEHVRVALFAPFEGRYQEVGYNALYAARLAIADAGGEVDLLAVDDGGTQAVSHAAALSEDPLVLSAVVLGYDGTSPEALKAFGDIPVLIIGDWGAQPADDADFILSNPQIDTQISVPPRLSVIDAAQVSAPVIGGDVFALAGFAKLRSALGGVTVLSSGSLPDAAFAARYKASDSFAPPPGLLATLSYDATMFAVNAARNGQEASRTAAREWISGLTYDGINGAIHFQNGYWANAPIHRYDYANGALTEDAVK